MGCDGNGYIDKQEAINAIIDYFNGFIDKALAVDVIICYFTGTEC